MHICEQPEPPSSLHESVKSTSTVFVYADPPLILIEPAGGAVSRSNLAITVLFSSIATVHVALPAQSVSSQPQPLKPEKRKPSSGSARRVMNLPEANISVQSIPQSIPFPVTVPE